MSTNKPSCMVIFPPVWEMAAPFLAGPALVGYLRSKGFPASLFDANNFFWDHFKNPANAANIWDRCVQEKDNPNLNIEDGIVSDWAANSAKDDFIRWFTSTSIDSPNYELLVRCFGGFRGLTYTGEEDPLRYHDKYFADISHSYASVHSGKLFDYIYNDNRNPWPSFARDSILPVIEGRRPAVLGISIVAPNQVIPAFAIAAEARRAWPQMHIIFGGAWVTHLRARIAKVQWFREKEFFFVPFQGEKVLEQVMEALQFGGDVNKICQDALCSDTPLHRLPLADLPTPDFSDLNLDTYAEPGHIPLMASKGCYWARCQFCSYPLIEPKYEVRSRDNLRKDLLHYVNEYRATHIPFTDPSISVPVAKRISETIKQEGLHLTWGAFARLEAQFTREVLDYLAKHGCVVMHWGLETGSERIQRDLTKGIDFNIVKRVLSSSAEAGIHNRILMMYGFPQETEEDLSASLNIIENLLPNVGSVCWSRCTIEMDTGLSATFYGNDFADGLDLSLGTVADTLYPPDFLKEKEYQMQNICARLALRNSTLTSENVTKGAVL